MILSLEEFIAQNTGRPNVGDTPENRGQCVGLVECWLDNLGAPHIWGNAYQLLINAPLNAYQLVANTPSAIPPAGAIVVLGTAFNGTNGHTGIATRNCTASQVELFEQNDPIGSAPRLQTYGYEHVTGWLISNIPAPIFTPTLPQIVPTPPTPATTQVDSATFDKLVTKSTSLDVIGAYLGLPASQIDQVGCGDAIITLFKQLQTSLQDAQKAAQPVSQSVPVTPSLATTSLNQATMSAKLSSPAPVVTPSTFGGIASTNQSSLNMRKDRPSLFKSIFRVLFR